MQLKIGSGFLPVFLGAGDHAYCVVRDPLPDGTLIVGATMAPDLLSVVLLLESEQFPEVADGMPYPEIVPILMKPENHTQS
jgi:hypothetical protein